MSTPADNNNSGHSQSVLEVGDRVLVTTLRPGSKGIVNEIEKDGFYWIRLDKEINERYFYRAARTELIRLSNREAV